MEKMSSNTRESLRATFGDSPLVEVKRVFQAPVERVWQAWSMPDLFKQWWGPEGYSCPECKIDFQVGGRILAAMQGPDAKITWSGGEYEEIIPFEKIVCTDEFTDKNGNPVSAKQYGMPGEWPETLLITINFEKSGPNETKLSIVHEGIPKDMHDDCVQGWDSSFDKLKRLVEKS